MTATAERQALSCMGCKRNANFADPQVLRCGGWRIWSGLTIGGQEHHAVYCPPCAGTAPVDEETGEAVGYTAGCHTCMEDLEPEDYPGGVTKGDAEDWADEHQCEADTYVTPPKAKK